MASPVPRGRAGRPDRPFVTATPVPRDRRGHAPEDHQAASSEVDHPQDCRTRTTELSDDRSDRQGGRFSAPSIAACSATAGGSLRVRRSGRLAASDRGNRHRITGNRRGQRRGLGYDFVHVCIDDHSRVAYVEILPDERGETAAAFFARAVQWYAQFGVKVQRVLTDNGTCYRAHVFAAACRDPAIRHLRTKPYTPRTNGKAERLIQTLLREWAYRYPFRCSFERKQLLTPYLHFYNYHRMHSALADQPPISRLNLNNVLRRDS